MYHEKEALWVKVILNKYCSYSRNTSRDPEKLPSSPNWKAISLGFPIFQKGISWGIGNGSGVKVWMNNWVNGDSLRGMIEGPLRQREQNLTVADLYCGQNWKWELISFDLPQPIKEKLKVVPIQLHGSGRDTVLWKFSKNGEFTVGSAYRLANQGSLYFGLCGQFVASAVASFVV
nr:putative ribonuclease h protein [Quercus suber]